MPTASLSRLGLWIRYLVVGVIALVVTGSLFFVATGAVGITPGDHAYGWLFGGWLIAFAIAIRYYGAHLGLAR